MDETEITALALDIMRDFKQLSTKTNIDPSDSYINIFKLEDDTVPQLSALSPDIQSYDDDHDGSISIPYPTETESVQHESITIISDISSRDSLYDMLPPIPSSKHPKHPTHPKLLKHPKTQNHQNMVIHVEGNKKRGVKKWSKRHKSFQHSYTPSLPHSELIKNEYKYSNNNKCNQYNNYNTKTNAKRSNKYPKNKNKKQKEVERVPGIDINDSIPYTMDIGVSNTISRKNAFHQNINEKSIKMVKSRVSKKTKMKKKTNDILQSKTKSIDPNHCIFNGNDIDSNQYIDHDAFDFDPNRCIFNGNEANQYIDHDDVNDINGRKNSYNPKPKNVFHPISLIPMASKDYDDNTNPFRASIKSEDIIMINNMNKSKKRKKRKKKKKKKRRKSAMPRIDSKTSTKNRKLRKKVLTPTSYLNAHSILSPKYNIISD